MKSAVAFLLGAATGSILTYLYMRVRTDQQIAEMEEYCYVQDKYLRRRKEEDAEEEPKEDTESKPDHPDYIFTPVNEEDVSYSKLYRNRRKTSEDDEEDEAYVESERDFDAHQKNKDREPRIISSSALEDLEVGWEQQTLIYFLEDRMLTTEDYDLIPDPKRLVGDCLNRYGFADNDERTIFVQNFRLQTVYEVIKHFGRSDD